VKELEEYLLEFIIRIQIVFNENITIQ